MSVVGDGSATSDWLLLWANTLVPWLQRAMHQGLAGANPVFDIDRFGCIYVEVLDQVNLGARIVDINGT